MRELLKKYIFSSLRYHDVQNHDPFQDLHSTQISKAIVNECLNIRLLRYRPTFTEDKILNSNIGKRQSNTKQILFKGFSLQTLLLFTDFNHYLVYFCGDGLYSVAGN